MPKSLLINLKPLQSLLIAAGLGLGGLLLLLLILAPHSAAAPAGPASSRPSASLPAAQGEPQISRASITGVKLIAPPGLLDPAQDNVTLWHDYGAFALYLAPPNRLSQLQRAKGPRLQRADWMDTVELQAYPITRSTQLNRIPQLLRTKPVTEPALHLIQFVGPIKPEWLQTVEKAGGAPVHYVANNAYLVWVDDQGRTRLDSLARQGQIMQLSLPYQPYFKLGPSLLDRLTGRPNPEEIVPVVIQLYRHPGLAQSEALIRRRMVRALGPAQEILAYKNLYAELRVGDLAEIAGRPDVVWLGERFERELLDEVQAQILAGNLTGDQSGPSSPGYLSWLDSYGFSADPADYPVVDIVDDGIGDGTVNSGDRTLHEFGEAFNPTRLAYVANCTSAANGGGPDGHGHINASIAGGYDTRTGFPFEDDATYQRGLGINPYGRLAGTRIFDEFGFDISACGGTDSGVIKSIQDNGAQIASNSWGCGLCGSSYDDSSQAFDVGVRDADLIQPGNQPLVMIFAAGNDGPGSSTIGTPGNGKNMITVGASENDRPTWFDGCGVPASGADDAMDIIDFSSRGPAPGGRVKPEIIAPGTHIQGTASTNSGYTGSGVCDQFEPDGQTIFAASSGTSHSTPGVAGVASLYYYWLENSYGLAPTPALLKSYLIAHPTYLTGLDANDTLPSNDQGYGMPNMSLAFDDTPRQFVNQTVRFDKSGETWTWTGTVADASRPVRLVLAYTDEAGTAFSSSPEVNNLNLAAEIDGTSYLGNVFSGQWSVSGGGPDNDNNYEAIFLPAGTSGAISITVTAFNIAGDGVPNVGDRTDQDFALVCYNCAAESDFTLKATPSSQAICAPSEPTYTVTLGQILGFADQVFLTASGLPLGALAQFNPNPVSPPGTSLMTIANTGAAPAGDYTIQINGAAATRTHTTTVQLELYTAPPGSVSLDAPANGAMDVALQPSLAWSSASQAQNYLLEIAADSGFNTVVYSTTTHTTTHTVADPLATSATYYWRVQPENSCGQGSASSVFSFTTRTTPPILLVDDDDNSPDVRGAYTVALEALGYSYDVWDTANTDTNEPSAVDLAPYKGVIWFSGDAFSFEGDEAGPGSEGETALASWLDSGEKFLFISSQDYHFDHPLTGFMQTYLGVDLVEDDVSQEMVTGQNIFAGQGPDTLDYPFTNFSDQVIPDSTAQLAFLGDAPGEEETALTKDSGDYRTAFFGYPFEALPTAARRETVMEILLEGLFTEGTVEPYRVYLPMILKE